MVVGMSETTGLGSAQNLVRTFLIADVRGYTRFTMERGDEEAARLAGIFARIAREVVTAHGGEVPELRGDEALAVFTSARSALRAAVALSRCYAEQTEKDPSLPLSVGIGLDAGEAIPVEGGYRGGALNLAARLCSLAGGGDVLSSETVIGLARKTEGIAFLDRGDVTLKGLVAPVRVIQIAADSDLSRERSPLPLIPAMHPHNLPDEPTRFIGRSSEITAVAALLREPHTRLVTLTGPGGAGKTRLALQVGAILLDDYRDGVFFVDLGSLVDRALVPSAIAEVLGVEMAAGVPVMESLFDALKGRELLLMLDNFEHLLDAAPVVADLLDHCRELCVLVTSRIPLHLSREHEHVVPPLSVPNPKDVPDSEHLSQYESVALFLERAGAVKDSFVITDENAPAIAEICYHLDGLPLAIELAAARIRLFPPQALLQRLDRRLAILTGGARDRPTRQQTLRGAIDWSYSLLDEREKKLFARLSIFAGGCTLEAAEVVCQPEGDLESAVWEGMASLVEKSLLRQDGEAEQRFSMLETLREYAAEKLEGQDADSVRRQHVRWCLAIVAGHEDEDRWLACLDAERDNLRAALRFAHAHDSAAFARLVVSLAPYWRMRTEYAEGRAWVESAVADAEVLPPEIRAEVFRWAGFYARAATDHGRAEAYLEQALELLRDMDAGPPVVDATFERAANLYEGGDVEAAGPVMEEAARLAREAGDAFGEAKAQSGLGVLAWERGDWTRATQLTEDVLAVYRRLGNEWGIRHSLCILGYIARDEGRFTGAIPLYHQALQIDRERVNLWDIAFDLEGLATVEAAIGAAERAAVLDGAAAAIRERIHAPLHAVARARNQAYTEAARRQLEEEYWICAWSRGRAMTLEQTIDYALLEAPDATGQSGDVT